MPSGISATLYAVVARGAEIYAVGTGGVLLQSSDGGASFSQAQLGARTLRGLGISALGIFAVGDGGAIFRRP